MGDVTCTVTSRWRNNLGQFSAKLEAAASAALQESFREGAALSAALAPRRTDALAGSIHTTDTGWATGDLPQAMPQEHGAAPHSIGYEGQILANKEEGFGPVRGPVAHPGNPGVHYLLRAFQTVFPKLLPRIRSKL